MASEKKILLLGSGFVAGPCAEYLSRRKENKITVACRRIAAAKVLCGNHRNTTPISLDVNNFAALSAAISQHDIVISLVPYTLHAQVIKAAIQHKKHVVTTSYISPSMKALDEEAKKTGITVMNEIGVDPGVDHLYALKTIWAVHKAGGKINSFTSYCGGLPAPECSNNPLGYKFSWSSRGVLLALRNEAKFIENGVTRVVPGPELLNSAKSIYSGYPAFAFEGYANRDSTPYDERYNISEAKTIIRGTLRYQGFPKFMQALVNLGFLDDSEKDYLLPTASEITWVKVLGKLLGTTETLQEKLIPLVVCKAKLVDPVEIHRIIDGMRWIGLFSSTAVTLRSNILDTLCATLEQKMQYGEDERDMVFLQHRFEVETNEGKKETHTSTLVEYGQPNGITAMAKTVGLPCGIATQLILDGKLTRKGVIAPMSEDVVFPLMEELEKEGISMVEEVY